MESRVALIGIIVENRGRCGKTSTVFYTNTEDTLSAEWVSPYREQKNENIISIAVDAPQDIISAMSGQNRKTRRRKCQNRVLKCGNRDMTGSKRM